MRALRISIAAGVCVVLLLSGLSAPAQEQPPGNIVTEWNLIAVNTLVTLPGPAGGAPPASQILLGMTQGAVFDAVNAIRPRRFQPYLLTQRFPSGSSKEAAVATAAYLVLSDIVSTVPDALLPTKATVLASLETEYSESLAAIPDSWSKEKGIEAGTAAAEAMIEAREDDGRYGPSQWDPNPKAGHWEPLYNPDGTPQLDPTPWVGGVDPFLLRSASQFRTEGPPGLRSEKWADVFNEVKELGSVDSAVRTDEQTHIAIFWQSTPVATWNAVARDLLGDSAHVDDLTHSARLFAMENLSAADASINCWNDKYHYDFWRPWNAIPRADEDRNPATEADPDWAPLINAPYPEHPSGHLCQDGSHLRVLTSFFGTGKVGFDVTSARFPGETRHFDRFRQAFLEIIEARIWAGLHFRTADVQARLLGRDVANYAMAHYLQPVD